MGKQLEDRIATQYSNPNLLADILDGLKRSGADISRLSIEDLAPVDEFHTAGRITTHQALAMTPISSGMHVLDAGSGIGGTARCLAREKGCYVTGIDLTADYVDVARELSARTGLNDVCTFQQGSVLDLPFEDATFDAAVSFHVAMNIEDRTRFYSELSRVLRPKAPLCLFDVMQGPNAGMSYPVPWADVETNSFLKTPIKTKSLVEAAGFEVVAQKSLRTFAIDFFRKVFAKAATQDTPALGLHLLTGAKTTEKFHNYAKGLNDHMVDPVIMVATRHS
ncbi:MAG: class I SAM-dependent methyltransferase [Pseudomonadota bacterium]